MYRRLFGNRHFTALWAGQAVSAVGDYFTMLAIPIFVNRLTGSVMLVGLSFVFSALPALFLGPVAGVFVDRLDRRKVMIASDVARGLLMLALLFVRDASQVWIVYLVGFLVSCASQFFFPARAAVLPLIVTDPDDWLAANATMRIVQTVSMLAGPALAGVTIQVFGERFAFIADGSSFFLSAVAISLMAVPRTTPGLAAKTATVRGVWNELREGLHYLAHSRNALGILICMTMAMVGFSTVNMLWIPYLQKTYGVGAGGLGIADAALGLGMLVSGVMVGQIARRASKKVMSAGSLLVQGLMYMLIIFLPAFGWIIAWQFLGGLAVTPLQSALDTLMQHAVPDLKRGRVSSVMNASYNTTGLVAMAFASLFGETIGLRWVFVTVGGFVFVAGLLGFWLLEEPGKPPHPRPFSIFTKSV